MFILYCQGHSQKFVSEGDKTGGIGSPTGSRGRALVGVWGFAPRSRRHTLITIAIMC